jgi:hypothetical protein
MVRFVRFVFLFATAWFATAPVASAQSNQDRQMVRVQVSVSYTLPVPAGEDSVLKAQEDARRSLYLVADKECALLRETIAAECKIESINVNVNRVRHIPNPETITANASMTYRVQLK